MGPLAGSQIDRDADDQGRAHKHDEVDQRGRVSDREGVVGRGQEPVGQQEGDPGTQEGREPAAHDGDHDHREQVHEEHALSSQHVAQQYQDPREHRQPDDAEHEAGGTPLA